MAAQTRSRLTGPNVVHLVRPSGGVASSTSPRIHTVNVEDVEVSYKVP